MGIDGTSTLQANYQDPRLAMNIPSGDAFGHDPLNSLLPHEKDGDRPKRRRKLWHGGSARRIARIENGNGPVLTPLMCSAGARK
jgi:hypothetical protein